MFPVQRDLTGLGEVVSGTGRDDAKRGIFFRPQYAVSCLVNAAVPTRDDDARNARINLAQHLGFNIASRSAAMNLKVDSLLFEQFNYPFLAPACATAPGSWVQKQAYRVCGHLPMLQCRRLFSQNGYAEMLELGVKFLISYFIGSLMGAMIMGKLRGGVDIRTMGSGNAGGTNALRTQGIFFALGVVIIDIGKGVIGAGVVPELTIPFVPNDPMISRTWLAVCCSAAAVLGHVWPIYHGFKGGKGAGTFVGTLVILGPGLIIGVLLVWAWVLVLSGFVGLATMSAATALPIYLGLAVLPDNQPIFIYTTVMAMFIIFWHRSNIQRMRDGTEHRNSRVMIFRRKKTGPSDDQS